MMAWTRARLIVSAINSAIVVAVIVALFVLPRLHAQSIKAAPRFFEDGSASTPLAAAAASNPSPSPTDARLGTVAKADIANLETAIDAFVIDNGRYPTAQEGLSVLVTAPPSARNWHGPYMKQLPQDPWKHPYHYTIPGIHHPRGFDLWSVGSDGINNTDDDISNWKN